MQIVESADTRGFVGRSSRVQDQGGAATAAPDQPAPATAHAAATQTTAAQEPAASKPTTKTTAVQQHAWPRSVVLATEPADGGEQQQ